MSETNLNLTSGELLQSKIDYLVSKINFGSMLFGIFANILCISVFANRQQLKKKFHYYLLSLAIADLLYCVIVFLNYLVFLIDPPNVIYDMSRITCYFTDYIVGSIDAFCFLITLVLSVDRLYVIARPFNFRDFITYRSPKLLIMLYIVVCLMLKSPEVFLSQRDCQLEESMTLNSSKWAFFVY